MSRQIIDEEDGFGILVNTFWRGNREGVQITPMSDGYTQMNRDEAVKFFRTAARRLNNQIKKDEEKPPWWQELSRK